MKKNPIINPKSKKSKQSKAKGGARPGAGRKKGIHNRRTEENIALAQAQNITPLGFILAMLNDPNETQENRKWAAKEGLAYTAPRLASVEMNHSGSVQMDMTTTINIAAKP